jgi:hypothetical protein
MQLFEDSKKILLLYRATDADTQLTTIDHIEFRLTKRRNARYIYKIIELLSEDNKENRF